MELKLTHEQAKSLHQLLDAYEHSNAEVASLHFLEDGSEIRWDMRKPEGIIELKIPGETET